MVAPVDVLATKTKADLVVYGKIFTSEDNKIVEAFAVKDGKFVYVVNKKGVLKKARRKLLTTPAKGDKRNGYFRFRLRYDDLFKKYSYPSKV